MLSILEVINLLNVLFFFTVSYPTNTTNELWLCDPLMNFDNQQIKIIICTTGRLHHKHNAFSITQIFVPLVHLVLTLFHLTHLNMGIVECIDKALQGYAN